MTGKEIWKPINGWEGLYEVSNKGRARSLHTEKPKLIKGSTQGSGHIRIRLRDKGRTERKLLHSAILETFIGARPEGAYGCHNDGNPSNNHLDNLRWDTPSSNALDTVKHGRHWESKLKQCKRGHPFEVWNLETYGLKRGKRNCKACHRAYSEIQRTRAPREQLQQISDRKYRELAEMNREKN